jgi:hypothetical protein
MEKRMSWNHLPARLAAFTLAIGWFQSGVARLEAQEASRISSVRDLGLGPADVPVSGEAKLAYLVNPVLQSPAELEAMLRAGAGAAAAPEGWTYLAFSGDELRMLSAPARPGDTAAYGAVADVAEQFFKHLFTQVPRTERTLERLVQDEGRSDFPLAAFDARPRILASSSGRERLVETLVSVRLFMVHVERDRERDLRWVSRSELCFEDSAVGRSVLVPSQGPVVALASSVVDGLRGKIALSFAHSPVLRRTSGKIDEPRRDLIDRSISEVAPLPASPAMLPPPGPPAVTAGRKDSAR